MPKERLSVDIHNVDYLLQCATRSWAEYKDCDVADHAGALERLSEMRGYLMRAARMTIRLEADSPNEDGKHYAYKILLRNATADDVQAPSAPHTPEPKARPKSSSVIAHAAALKPIARQSSKPRRTTR